MATPTTWRGYARRRAGRGAREPGRSPRLRIFPAAGAGPSALDTTATTHHIITMNRSSAAAAVGLVILCLAASALGGSKAEDQLVRFLAGSELLACQASADPHQREQAFKSLAAVTGLEPGQAARLVGLYRGKPQELSALLKRVREALEGLR